MIDTLAPLAQLNIWIVGGIFLAMFIVILWFAGFDLILQLPFIFGFAAAWVFIATYNFGYFVLTLCVGLLFWIVVLGIESRFRKTKRGKIIGLPTKH